MRLPLEIYDLLVGRGLVKELPTTRLYLLEHIPALKARARVRARYLGANVFSLGATAFVVRETNAAGLRAARRFRRVVWIVDDHFAEGAGNETLPEAYRRRLGALHTRFEPQILAIADVVVCSCDALAEHYRAQGLTAVHTIHPLYGGAVAPHPSGERDITIGILQTRSHLADMRSIAPQINEVLAAHSNVSLVHCLGGCDTGLDASGRVEALAPMPWRAYVGWNRRLSIGLYPLLDTGFNRYRSLNKFLEYVGRGAVPLVADTPSMGAVPADFRVAPGDWRGRVGELAADPAGRTRLIGRARDWVADMRFQERARQTLEDLIA